MLGRTRFLLALLPFALACSSESAPPPQPPVWTDAPQTVDVYEGRSTDVPFTIKGGDPKTAHLEAAVEGALEAEVILDETPSTDGLVHGKLRLRAGYGLADVKLSVEAISGTQKTAPVVVALKTHALKWKTQSWSEGAGPPGLEHGTFMFDPDSRSAFLLQGSGYKPQWKPVEESWKLDLSTNTWSPWKPGGETVPGGAARRVASVPDKKIAYVHGGYTGFQTTETTVGDLYRVDLADPQKTITKINGGDPSSTARSLHTLAYDSKGDQLVVFGGVTETPMQMILDDTWIVKVDGTNATWTQLKSKKHPDGRYGAFAAFDAESRRFIVWSGARQPESPADLVNAAQDAWALDLTAEPPVWAKLEFEGATPPGRRNGCTMHDPIGRRMFVFGGTKDGKTTERGLWVLSLEPGGEKWTKLDIAGAPPARSSGFGFTMPDGNVACGFGNDDKAYTDVNLLGYFD